MTNETDRPLKQADAKDLKPYGKPTLVTGPVLSKITAVQGGSVTKDFE